MEASHSRVQSADNLHPEPDQRVWLGWNGRQDRTAVHWILKHLSRKIGASCLRCRPLSTFRGSLNKLPITDEMVRKGGVGGADKVPGGQPERVQFSWARPLGFFLTGKTQFGEVVRSFVHKNPTMTFHLHQSSDRSPTAEPAQARFYDIEVLDLISVRPEVLLTPPSEYHKEDQAVYKDEEGDIIRNAGHEGF